jgi:hypothetical protein
MAYIEGPGGDKAIAVSGRSQRKGLTYDPILKRWVALNYSINSDTVTSPEAGVIFQAFYPFYAKSQTPPTTSITIIIIIVGLDVSDRPPMSDLAQVHRLPKYVNVTDASLSWAPNSLVQDGVGYVVVTASSEAVVLPGKGGQLPLVFHAGAIKGHPDAIQFAAASPITVNIPQTTYDRWSSREGDNVGLHDSAVEVPYDQFIAERFTNK